jgi:hypothetical protein
MHMLHDFTITAAKSEVLDTLRENRKTHAAIVAEAREGYVDQAKKALEKRLGQLREGKLASLKFSLRVPQDHTKVYDTVITMLEMHTGAEVALNATQVRNLIEDNWDWKRDFLVGSSAYSKRASDMLDD